MSDGAVEAGGAGGEGAAAAQGGEANPLYAEILSGMPEELRPYGEKSLKEWDAKVTPKLQEAAQLRQKYEPFERIDGLADMDPQDLSALIQFSNVLRDPQQLSQWIANVAMIQGEGGEPMLSEDAWAAIGEQNGWFEGGEETEPDDIEQRLAAMLDERLGPLQQREQMREAQQQHEAQVAQIQERATQELEQVLGQLGNLSDEQREAASEAILKLAFAYIGEEDAILKAFADYQEITGVAKGDQVERRLAQPTNGALNGGRPSTEPPKMSFIPGRGVDPNQAALERLRG